MPSMEALIGSPAEFCVYFAGLRLLTLVVLENGMLAPKSFGALENLTLILSEAP